MIYSIYEDFIQSAKISPKNAKMILRHSLRGDIRKGEVGTNVLLTREGKVLAEHFGKHCKFSIERIFTSHIQRCVQTATYFAQGYANTHNIHLDIIPTNVLAECYITNITEAEKLFKQQSAHAIMSAFLRGEKLPGMRDLHSSMEILFGYVFQNDSENMELFITHDTFLLAIIGFISGSDTCDMLWPYMLEGAFLYYDSNKKNIMCIFRGVERSKHFVIQKGL
ncbi:histidine phosphatase family protein [Helicobacter aurati]|uniref:Histidine phosphatase family protein n=1 Tax=Helicobacter aurati TaxID=137778 RepID=A0A3D8J6A8_9HELI|nr:histidine phosphatase family protein [Helicobacter aurati]RDU72735.1 histidine phosphatase family protein [Helicobacter aurati]